MNIALNENCMDVMKRYPDQYFDLAVVDPPYGDIPKGGYMTGAGGGLVKQIAYHDAIWNQSKPDKAYFEELFRVSKNQIIWGANYFLPEIDKSSPCWIVWDKLRPDGVNFADCELAWTSFNQAARVFRYRWNGFIQQNMKNREQRIHPTQKPTDLYRWIFNHFTKTGFKILDTHLGSGTSRRAALEFGLDFVGCEIDKIYFDKQEQAWEEHCLQARIEGV